MKNLLILFFAFNTLVANANNFYFSSLSGDDSRTALQAHHATTPWKTVARLNSFFNQLQPGDSVLFKRGETFYGAIIINKSGNENSPIIIGSYGHGNKPVITGLTSLTLTSSGNNIFESQALDVPSINLLTINGVVMGMGRYPNANSPNKGYMIFQSHNGVVSITDNNLPSNPNWSGAELVLRSKKWIIDRDKITTQAGNTIFYTASSKNEPGNGFGYFIQNSAATLDQAGEWYYNPSTKEISIYYSSMPKDAKAATLDNLINASSQSNITFDNILFEGANANIFKINGGSNIIIQNADIRYAGEDGVKLNNHTNFKIENCTLTNSLSSGIEIDNKSKYAIVRNNEIRNTYLIAGMGLAGGSKGYGITTNSRASVIEYNRIINTGYIAINFSDKDSTIIKNNYIDSFCVTTNDGGGIYTYSGAKKTINMERKIIGNIVMNGIGSNEGTNDTKDLAAEGIYMDFNTDGVEINGNTVINCVRGIYLNKARNIVVKNNTCYNNKYQFYDRKNATEPVDNYTVTNNLFFSKLPTQLISRSKNTGEINLFGSSDNNYYAKTENGNISIYNNSSSADASIKNFKVDGLNDKNNSIRFEYNATTKNKTVSLDGNYVDVKNNKYSNSIILQPYTSVVLMKEDKMKLIR